VLRPVGGRSLFGKKEGQEKEIVKRRNGTAFITNEVMVSDGGEGGGEKSHRGGVALAR